MKCPCGCGGGVYGFASAVAVSTAALKVQAPDGQLHPIDLPTGMTHFIPVFGTPEEAVQFSNSGVIFALTDRGLLRMELAGEMGATVH